ncbi:hypothetical protein LCGC14_2803130 [marine sediment metagenome]|uniref:Uncharacterized protein n=1 Tax=marine sediment metagenome TaxID=412755 RepID=A0A0F9AVI9_9ZZZZ
MDDFGTPDANDATARNEKTVTEAAKYIVDLGEEAKSEVQNRDLGSVKISSQQQRQEFEAMQDNPEHLAQFFSDNKMTVENMVQYLKKMNK